MTHIKINVPEAKTIDAIYKKDFVQFFKDDFAEYLKTKLSEDRLNEFLLLIEVGTDNFDEEIVKLSNEFLKEVEFYKLFAYVLHISPFSDKQSILDVLKSGRISFDNAKMYAINDVCEERSKEIRKIKSYFERVKEERLYEKKPLFYYKDDLEDFITQYECISKYSYIEKVKEFCEKHKESYEKTLERLK